MASIYDSLGVLLTIFGNLELFELKGRLLKLLIWSNESQVTNKNAYIEYGPYNIIYISRIIWFILYGSYILPYSKIFLRLPIGQNMICHQFIAAWVWERFDVILFSNSRDSRDESRNPRTRTPSAEPCLSARSPSKEACMMDSIYLWQKIIDNQLKIRC